MLANLIHSSSHNRDANYASPNCIHDETFPPFYAMEN